MRLLPVARDPVLQGWLLQRARYPGPGSKTWVLQGSHLVIAKGRVQCPFVLFFSFLPQSVLWAGAPLPAPAAGTAFIKALPPKQTPFVRETDARGSSAGTDAPVCPPANKRCNIRLPSVPHTHTHACACCPMQDGVLGHSPSSPRLYSCSQPNGYPGTPLRVSEPLSAPGLPCCSPATLPGKGWQGAATPVVFGPLPGPHAPGPICSPSFQLPFQ